MLRSFFTRPIRLIIKSFYHVKNRPSILDIIKSDSYIPSCEDCKYYIPVDKNKDIKYPQCKLFWNYEWSKWISGDNKYVYTSIARMDKILCGKYGFHFTKKQI